MKQLAEQVYSEYRRNGHRNWLITSAVAGEGGSSIATMLAGELQDMISGTVAILRVSALTSSRMNEILEGVSAKGRFTDDQYEICIVDATGILGRSEVLRFAECVDSSLLVVRAERSSREVFRESLQLLERRGIHVSGVVLNHRRRRIPSWLYRCL